MPRLTGGTFVLLVGAGFPDSLLEIVGTDSVSVTGLPQLLGRGAVDGFLRDVLVPVHLE